MGLAPDTKCTYCRDNTDYIEHFFYECPKIFNIWKLVEQTAYKKYDVKVKQDAVKVLLGFNSNILSLSILKCINHVIITAKMCISKFRYGTPLEISYIFDRAMKLREL